jgi:hypothetical protein
VRKLATLPLPVSGIVRVMLYSAEAGTYLFLYDTDDGPCIADEWYEHAGEAEARCRRDFGVAMADWRTIPDPAPGGYHDRLS